MTQEGFCLRVTAAILLAVLAMSAPAGAENRSMLLVAVPAMDSPVFGQSVVLVTAHGNGAAIGVILNHPRPIAADTLFPPDHPLRQAGAIHYGGPVGPHSLVFLFRSPTAPEGALLLFDDIYMSRDLELLEAQLRRPRGDSGLQIYAGYAGWAPGQLQSEIRRGDWQAREVDAELLFGTKRSSLWEKLSEVVGDEWI